LISNLSISRSGWSRPTKTLPLSGAVPLNATGAANLKSPTGACPNGMPRYSETSESFFAGCPLTGPLLVWTVCPTVQLAARSSRSVAKTQDAAARANITKDLMAEILSKHVQQEREEKATEWIGTYTCTPPRVQCTVPIPNDFPIGLRRNLSLISKSGPTSRSWEEWVTFLSLPRGQPFPLRLAHRSSMASQIVAPGGISNRDRILLGWASAGHLVYAEKEAQRHPAGWPWGVGEVTCGEEARSRGLAGKPSRLLFAFVKTRRYWSGVGICSGR
jgi:hypothetical protein